jgi:hypothetical protein
MDVLEFPPDGAVGSSRLFDILEFIMDHCAPDIQGSSLKGYIASIRRLVALRYGYTLAKPALLTEFLTRFSQLPSAKPKRFMQPATTDLVSAVWHDRSIHVAVRSAVLLGFHGLLRVSEYTCDSAHVADVWCLAVRHVHFDSVSGTMAVHLPRSKSDPFNTGLVMHFAPLHGDPICPVRAVRRLIKSFGPDVSPDRPLFSFSASSFVTRPDIAAAVKKHAHVMHLSPQHVSTHSLRIGGAFSMKSAGVDWATIVVRARWKAASAADMLLLYTRMSKERLCEGGRALTPCALTVWCTSLWLPTVYCDIVSMPCSHPRLRCLRQHHLLSQQPCLPPLRHLRLLRAYTTYFWVGIHANFHLYSWVKQCTAPPRHHLVHDCVFHVCSV